MQVKANGKTYEVSTAPPGGEHVVKLAGAEVGAFVLEPEKTKVTRGTSKLIEEIADKFVDLGGAPMGML